jgi:uncharacterized protein YndB with AHSA1/START domain
MLTVIGVLAAALLAAIAIIVVLAARKPDTFRVQRSVTIEAPPDRIFPLINEFDNWSQWSPYEKKDPAMQRTRSGPPGGKGAHYAWEGNGNVGKGSMEIADSVPPSRVTLDLHFDRPFISNNVVNFTLEPKGRSTDVTWAMQGPVPFVAKIMHVLCNMDRMVGRDFEAGLASMKAVAEQQPARQLA